MVNQVKPTYKSNPNSSLEKFKEGSLTYPIVSLKKPMDRETLDLSNFCWRTETHPIPFNDDTFYLQGQSFRSAYAQAVLKQKTRNAKVLLVRENNPHDKNAVMVFVAGTLNSNEFNDDHFNTQNFSWWHVGYVPRNLARLYARDWPKIGDSPVILEATVDCPDRIAGAITVRVGETIRRLIN